MIPPPAIQDALASLESTLLSSFNPDRPWTGHLCNSAVSTAVAVVALHTVNPDTHQEAIKTGLAWLLHTRNPDGGWGDTPESPTNITATLLAAFAFHAASSHPLPDPPSLAPHVIVHKLRERYGKDNTFSAPILTMGALSGYLGSSTSAWSLVPQLPFELAAVSSRWFRLMNMGVVSYAIPALIAIGLVRHKHCPTPLLPLRKLRDRLTPRLLEIARSMQPSNGGFEEATPLTSFVAMSLAASGFRSHPIVERAVSFILSSQRPDGGWPIDTDLATWVTSQSVCALTEPVTPPRTSPLSADQRDTIRRWLLAQQYTSRHPLTGGAPGGWGWTNLPGAMPDADDTAGVLLALRRLGPPTSDTLKAVPAAIDWLINLQNHDGGIPTFCRGWGKLPFDRSCPDLTAHAFEAFAAWLPVLPQPERLAATRSMRNMLRYLAGSQSRRGSWLALWFGTQAAPDEANPVYGTARAVLALDRSLPCLNLAASSGGSRLQRAIDSLSLTLTELRDKGCAYLLHTQDPSGGWGPQPGLPPSIEETAMALSALAGRPHQAAIERGTRALLDLTQNGTRLPSAPIGLYFARLWYSEELYPVIFSITALRRCSGVCRESDMVNDAG